MICNNVVLPEPEAPTMATRSAWPIERSTPERTSRVALPSRKRRTTPRHSRTRASFIPECLGRQRARAAPCRIYGGQQRENECDAANPDDVRDPELGRQIADEINVCSEKLDAECRFHEAHDVL